MADEQYPDISEDPSLTYSPEKTRILTDAETRVSEPPDHRQFRTSAWNVMDKGGTGEKPPPVSQRETMVNSSAEEKGRVPIVSQPEYTLRRVVGKGGFGEVWEAKQGSLDRLVAVKRIKPERRRKGKGAAAEELFRQEAATTAYLEHPNIVPIHDLGADAAGSPMLAMKLVRGRPWNALLREEFHALSVADFLAKHIPILVEVCQAVAFAHSRGIIHRDIKPAQVMIGEFGEVVLMDWGLAVWKEPDDPLVGEEDLDDDDLWADQDARADVPPQIPTVATASNPAGTPALMAPEQTIGSPDEIDFRTDVYLLGGTLYCLLTGRFPHQTKDARESIQRAQAGVVVPPEERAPERTIPRELSDLCKRALQSRKEDRVPTALDFMMDLKDFLSGTSRRRDSVRFTDELLEDLTRESRTYEDLERDLGRLERAAALWADNPALSILTERVLDEFARAALERGDLHLARYHASRMDMGKNRLELLSRLEEREEELAARTRQRKLALCAFVLLVFLFAAGSIVVAGLMRTRSGREQEMLATQNATRLAKIEREKELQCMYAVAEALRAEPAIDGLLRQSATILPAAWQHAEVAVARIAYGGETYTSEGFAEPPMVQSAPLVVNGEEAGLVEVGYTEERPPETEGPFLAEERHLIDAVARLLGEGIERRLAQ